jgi:hypothetical protein
MATDPPAAADHLPESEKAALAAFASDVTRALRDGRAALSLFRVSLVSRPVSSQVGRRTPVTERK